MFVDCMRRLGRIENLPPIEVIAAEEFGYRHRAQFKIDMNGNAGFFARQTNTVIPVRRCPLLTGPLNNLLDDIAGRKISLPGPLKNLFAISGDSGSIASYPVIAGRTSESVTITVGNRTFEVPGYGFFQSNRPLLERLGTWARDYVEGKFCVDLYGGSGFFSAMLADRFKKGLLIESIGAQVSDACENFKRNGIGHFQAIEGIAEDLSALTVSKSADFLIADPPRPGLTEKVRQAVAKLAPKTILYVSCNPSTQARDAGFLVTAAGYAVTRAAIVDLYPNTHHIESLLILEKRFT
jgi:23S rRNA (uracil1939-C5)-methyltransferase